MTKTRADGGTMAVSGDADGVLKAQAYFNINPAPAAHLSNKPVRILFLSANPAGSKELKLITECNNVRNKIKASRYSDDFDFEQWHEASLHGLQGYLLGANPQIVHFSGHGAEDGTLVFEDFGGQPEMAKIQAIANLFRILNERRSIAAEKKVRCVVLSACYSEVQARELAKYVDCVVGMKNA
ncbi:MAG: CHAT domain-containing protein, partial [Nitrososphaera sp.]|nr:CHAT domain-containing protein [Nitrososphaera sp.]